MHCNNHNHLMSLSPVSVSSVDSYNKCHMAGTLESLCWSCDQVEEMPVKNMKCHWETISGHCLSPLVHCVFHAIYLVLCDHKSCQRLQPHQYSRRQPLLCQQQTDH